MIELHMSPEDFSELKDWTLLPVSDFLDKVRTRYGRFPAGEEIRVVVDWQPRIKHVFDNWPDGSVVRPPKPEFKRPL